MANTNDTIAALATANGIGAIAVIRVSGPQAIAIVNEIFKGKDLNAVPSHSAHFGQIVENNTTIDEVLATVFVAPRSFTKENSVEISVHGSPFIIQKVLQLLILKGVRMANPGEFTQRAYLNGAFDLAQAEAIADVIAADSAASHRVAMNQLRGGFSNKLKELRAALITFASLVELELDFGEEDVEFADRNKLEQLVKDILVQIKPMLASFSFGNVLKEGIPIAIVGPPNVGKSTLLNTLFNEEKAIVTPIAGTTRDIVEDTLIIEGVKFRIIDTAGIRQTTDLVESIGIERSKGAILKADIVILLFTQQNRNAEIEEIYQFIIENNLKERLIIIENKVDLNLKFTLKIEPNLKISAANQSGISDLKELIFSKVALQNQQAHVITNSRHYESLLKTQEALLQVLEGLQTGITGDFIAQDIRLSLYHLGLITGEVSPDDLLEQIFSKFCIGK